MNYWWVAVASVAISIVYGMMRVNYTRFRSLKADRDKLLEACDLAYVAFWSLSPDDPVRVSNQQAMARLRDAIAGATGIDSEAVSIGYFRRTHEASGAAWIKRQSAQAKERTS